MNSYLIKIILVVTISLMSCVNDKKTDELDFSKIVNSQILKKYEKYKISPYYRRKNTTRVTLPDGSEFLVVDLQGNPIVMSKSFKVNSEYSIKEEKQLLNELEVLYDTLVKYNVVAVIGDSLKTEYFLDYSDSTYMSIKVNNPGYHDIYYDKDKKDGSYRYVLVNYHNSNQLQIKIDDKRHTMHFLNKNWYYYRSQYYSIFNKP
jgi:inosine/xanthosine triphosphate pyrophosphatase family protein